MSGTLGAIGATAWQLAFELSPVVLTNGIAQFMPGSLLPIILLTDVASFPLGVLSSGTLPDASQAFAHWRPLAGTELIKWQWGEYPFANQAIAANAGIKQARRISMLMQCPAQGVLGYPAKLATMMALKIALDAHAEAGGTYTVITPTAFEPNCLLDEVVDISGGETNQPQTTWQWNFRKPLITLDQAQQVQSSLIAKITSGTPADQGGSWAGLSPAVGNPNTVAGQAIVPSALPSQAAGIAPLVPVQQTPLPPLQSSPGIPFPPN